MADWQANHEKAMAQRVGNLPADIQKVRDQISANTKQQLNTVETMNQVKFDLKQTDLNIGHMHHLVGDLRHRTVGSAELLEENRRLSNALQEERISSKTSLALLADYKAHLQLMQQREERFLAEIDRLRSELAEIRSQKQAQEAYSQTKKESAGGTRPPTSEYADLLEASRNPNWASELARSSRHSK